MTSIRPFETAIDGLTLRGSLYLPDDLAQPRPTVVLFHGFGGSRVETSGAFVTLGRALAASGQTVLAYDRAGHGESDGEFFDTTVSTDVRHAKELLTTLAAVDEVDADNLHLVGMSLGAVVASVVAAETATHVRSLTMWSTAAVFVDDIRAGAIQGRSLTQLETDGYFDFMGMRMGKAMQDDALTFDPYERARGFRGNTQLLHGTEDFVPVRYAERYLEVFGDRAELLVVDGADHGWAKVPHRDLVVAKTVEFITKQAQR